MGLLDDAIREHLELKRLRGADPGEVARAENDALGPVLREADTLVPEGEQGDTDTVVGEDGSEPGVGKRTLETPEPEDNPGAGVGQETVEINMEAELGGEPKAPPVAASPAGGRTTPADDHAHMQPSTGDSLEWEMPGDRKVDPSGEGTAEDEQAAGEEPVEDVLEETPDFLRETPEQDRLWFEQRPPRDFDFNE